MRKILSIAIPMYNMEKYIDRCLSSLVISSPNIDLLDVIVINDGSKDDSLRRALVYQNKYPESFRVIDKDNGNYGSCINRALQEAQGDYFKILDADDWYDTQELEKFLLFLKTTNADVVFSKYNRHHEVDGHVEIQESDMEVGKTFFFDQYKFSKCDYLRMHCICVKTNNLKRNGYWQQEGISYTDTEFSYFSVKYSKSFVFTPYIVYQYLYGRPGQSVDSNNVKRNYYQFVKIGLRLMDDYLEVTPQTTKHKKQTLLLTFYHLSMGIYIMPLFSLKQMPTEMKSQLHSYDKLVCNDKLSKRQAMKMLYYKVPFYLVWKLFGIRIGSIIGK